MLIFGNYSLINFFGVLQVILIVIKYKEMRSLLSMEASGVGSMG